MRTIRKMNSEMLKTAARRFGADLVGVAPISRLTGLPAGSDPKLVAPAAMSVIAVAMRVLRGSLRGVEEGTNLQSTYHGFGFTWLEDQFLSRTIASLAEFLEEEGVEAVPLLGQRHEAGEGGFVPAVNEMAEAAGLGSVGRGGFFLTPEFGHRQRVGFVFAAAEFEPDAPRSVDFCEGCSACVAACPLGALDGGADSAARPLWNRCRQCRNGVNVMNGRAEPVDRFAAACGRACANAVENKISNKFAAPFRKREPWSRNA